MNPGSRRGVAYIADMYNTLEFWSCDWVEDGNEKKVDFLGGFIDLEGFLFSLSREKWDVPFFLALG